MFSPKEVAENLIAIGKKKAETPVPKLFLLGILAGMFIAFACVGANTASSLIENAAVAKLVGACVFPVGLSMVIVAGSELFTGDNLMVISLLEKEITPWQLIRCWIVVYIGNFVGAVATAWVVSVSAQLNFFGNAVAVSAIKTALMKVSYDFHEALLLGILCNIVVCIAVWMSFAAKNVSGKMAIIFMPVMLFILSGFEHSIANMYYISVGLFAAANPVYKDIAAGVIDNLGNLTWSAFFIKNLLPVTIGNIIGGGGIVGCSYWYIYLKGRRKEKPVEKIEEVLSVR